LQKKVRKYSKAEDQEAALEQKACEEWGRWRWGILRSRSEHVYIVSILMVWNPGIGLVNSHCATRVLNNLRMDMGNIEV
jgi:hypothetical protein